ncbi:MAG: glycosyltransferase [Saprospiraceae bacterium]|nr:MAG: glycosyltransferase [Saprospiraceae bacterium]
MENLSTWEDAGWGNRSTANLRTPSVAIISDERFPHYATNTQQVVKNADALAAAGLPSDLIIPVQWKGLFRPGYDVADAISKYYNVPRRTSIKKIFTIPASNLRIEKVTHCIAALIYASIRKYDVIYTRNEFTAIMSVLLGKKTVFETYRKFGDEYPRFMRWLSKYACKPAFLGMILHSRLSFDSMRWAGFPAEKLAVFHNGFDYADMQPMLTKTEAREILGWEKSQRHVVYTGNMQVNKGIESVIDIAGKMPAVKFVLVGGTLSDSLRLQNYAEQNAVSNVTFTGFKAIKEVSCYLYAADALIIPPVSAPLEKYGRTVLPFKTFLYLAAGRPVLAPLQPDLTEVLEDDYNALLVEPDNLDAAVAALESLFANPAMHLRISENAAASVSDLTWDARAKKIIRWLTNAFHGYYPVFKQQEKHAPAKTAVTAV